MGSSGSTNYKQPTIPRPPNVAEPGSSVPFQPNFINFLGDTNQPSTGLTPGMLQQIDSMSYAPPPPPAGGGMSGDRNMLAEIMAKLDAMNRKPSFSDMVLQQQTQRRRFGGGADR